MTCFYHVSRPDEEIRRRLGTTLHGESYWASADLIADVGIDAKHSFEDVIVPVETFQARWGDRVAVLGGVDVDLLGRGSAEQVRKRTMQILETCVPRGGYACGSGNSVTDYVPAANYLAMAAAVHEFNGRM